MVRVRPPSVLDGEGDGCVERSHYNGWGGAGAGEDGAVITGHLETGNS